MESSIVEIHSRTLLIKGYSHIYWIWFQGLKKFVQCGIIYS